MPTVAIKWRFKYITLYSFIGNPSYNINNFLSSDSAYDEKFLFELFNLHFA